MLDPDWKCQCCKESPTPGYTEGCTDIAALF